MLHRRILTIILDSLCNLQHERLETEMWCPAAQGSTGSEGCLSCYMIGGGRDFLPRMPPSGSCEEGDIETGHIVLSCK